MLQLTAVFPPLRPSRFHTEKGQLALRSIRDGADASYALFTTVLRVAFDYRVAEPWIAKSAFRIIRQRVSPSWRVFEWGSGMSTLWYERHCAEVYAVEDNPAWHELMNRRANSAQIKLLQGSQYVNRILDFPEGYFDLISIDGSSRCECLLAALPKLKPSGILVIDNTDKDRTTHGDLFRADGILETLSGFRIQRFVGWAPGNFFPQETTLCFPER